MDMMKDNIYKNNVQGPFRFDDSVADVFHDMINRSVPGYRTIIEQTGIIAEMFVKPDTNIYDLGCSLGASSLSVRHSIPLQNNRIIAVDNSAAMIKRAESLINRDHSEIPVETLCSDISDIRIKQASFVIINLTLQFLPLEKRIPLLKEIKGNLVKGGALLLTEKTYSEDEFRQELFDSLYYSFKKDNGYTDMEISRKRESLKDVLITETESEYRERLYNAGFTKVDTWFRCLNFISMIAQ